MADTSRARAAASYTNPEQPATSNDYQAERSLDSADPADLQAKVADVIVVGDPECWRLLCKASSVSQGFMKSTKVMHLPKGCLVQVSTQQRNPDGSWALAEAVVFVPQAYLEGPLAPPQKL